MGTLPAISVDSLGNTSLARNLGLPELRRDPGTEADRRNVLRVIETIRRDPPAQWTADRWQQARSFTNAVYIAVRAKTLAMSGCTIVVSQRRKVSGVLKSILSDRRIGDGWRKSLKYADMSGDSLPFMAFSDWAQDRDFYDLTHKANLFVKSQASATGTGESDWVPLDSGHELARLFEEVNERDTITEFLTEYLMNRDLFGQGTIYTVMGRDGKPAELWNLWANYLMPVGSLSHEYPRGMFRYIMPVPMLWASTSGQALVIPREHLSISYTARNPAFPFAPMSPLEAGGEFVDFLNSVVDSRQMAMDRGLSLRTIISLLGASPDQVGEFKKTLRERFTGTNRGEQFAVVDGDTTKATTVDATPDKMAYKDSYDHGVAGVLALFRTPTALAGLTDASSYSAFYAAVRQYHETTLMPEARQIGDRWTKDIIRPHWGPDYRVEIKLPPLMDPDLQERQLGTLMGAKAITRNEVRAKYDMPPLEDGDQTPDEFAAELQQQAQQQAQQQPGGEGGDDPLAALLGGGGMEEPGAPGEVDPPDVGGASEGSLPGAVEKSVGVWFRELVDEVMRA